MEGIFKCTCVGKEANKAKTKYRYNMVSTASDFVDCLVKHVDPVGLAVFEFWHDKSDLLLCGESASCRLDLQSYGDSGLVVKFIEMVKKL